MSRRWSARLFTEGKADKEVLGGKGCSLSEMSALGLPVPPGFTITTSVARAYMEHNRLPERAAWHVGRCLSKIEDATGKSFGDPKRPLLVSVRSGAPISMPGMMDTVLNIGITPEIVVYLSKKMGKK